VISLILLFVSTVPEPLSRGAAWAEMAKLLGGGLAIGLGTIGAGAGVGIAGVGGMLAISRQPKKEGSILRSMFIGMGVTESPTIYALVVSLILLFVAQVPPDIDLGGGLVEMAKFLGAGLAMGAGAIGPGLGIGLVTRDALTGIAKRPKEEGALVRTMFLGMAVTESTAIYALVVSLILLFAIT
jgi:ATP synthase F0 subunit c